MPLIQQLLYLSDERMKFHLLDRLIFQRLAGLTASSQIPDHTSSPIQAGASERIVEPVTRQLAKHGYIARGGHVIDACFVQVPKQSLSKNEKTVVKEVATSIGWKPAKGRQKDTNARWTKKHS